MLSKEQIIEGVLLYLADCGLSKAAFGEMCGVSPRRMQKILKGDVTPSDKEIEVIALMARLGEPKFSTPKKVKPSKKIIPNGVYLKGNQVIDDFMRVAGLDNRTLATTILVVLGWDTLVKHALDDSILDFLKEVARS